MNRWMVLNPDFTSEVLFLQLELSNQVQHEREENLLRGFEPRTFWEVF